MITADDFGLAREVNEAVEIAHTEGVLTAASLMVAGPAADHATALARRLPKLRVGLHLVLVDGASVLPPREIPDLVDGSGNLRLDLVRFGFDIALRKTVRHQIEKEIAAQIAAFRDTGLQLDHVNAHKHFHVHPSVSTLVLSALKQEGAIPLRVPCEPHRIVSLVDRRPASPSGLVSPWARALKVRARRAGIPTADYVFGLTWSGHVTRSRLFGLLDRLPPGMTEIYAHPATGTSFPGHAAGYAYVDELAALTDPSVVESVKSGPYRLGGYTDALDAERMTRRH